jgi:hypothetical protein
MFSTQPPETDLIVPLPAGEQWDPHTIHTHYFGLSVPEAQLGAFIYVRYQPAFPLAQGGVCIFRGLDNASALDMEFMDYQTTMPWPEIDGNTITTANGLQIEFLELGKTARLTYRSNDGTTSLDVVQTAITPLLARGHVVPGEEAHHGVGGLGSSPGGSEQFMRCTGELVVNGERHAVDCYAPRDRSWRQVRVERQGGAVAMPPIGWSPMCFGEDLIFNQVSIESPDTEPAYTGIFDVPADRPTHHFAWLYSDGDVRAITRVRRNVLEYHPVLHAAVKQEVEAQDEEGRTYRFEGEAIAMSPVPAWPNAGFCDSVYRWEDEQGRVTHSTYQELWFDKYQRAMHRRALTTDLA